MKILSRKEILEAEDIQVEQVLIPEWGEDAGVNVKGMNGSERDIFESSLVNQRGQGIKVNTVNIRAKLASLTVVDENLQQVFTEKDVREIGKKSASALQRIFEVAQRLSGISQGDVEELAEAMEDDPTEGSLSD